ncbi:hypothetical protein PG988_007273 [Apiospora saccharicola]
MARLYKRSVEYRLIQEDPPCKSSFVTPGQNTSGTWTVKPTGWRPWEDFNYSTLKRIFREELETNFIGSQATEPLDMTRTVFNERSLEGYIHLRIIEVVNDAIRSVQKKEPNHIGDGARLVPNNEDKDKKVKVKDAGPTAEKSKFESHLRPNWSMVPYASADKGLGTLQNNKKSTAEQEWEKVLSQVTTYMADNNCRYGFIITDAHLMALRLSLSGNPAPDKYADPEYCDIPWDGEENDEAGAGLAHKLALFFLCLLAGIFQGGDSNSVTIQEHEQMEQTEPEPPPLFTTPYTGKTKEKLEDGDEEVELSDDETQLPLDKLLAELVVQETYNKKRWSN